MWTIFSLLRLLVASRAAILAENVALRQQLAVLHLKTTKPKLRAWHRGFWIFISHWFADWKSWLVIVKPDTVVRWHRQGFRLYWRWKSRGTPGRPAIPRKLQALIRSMAKENPTWGVPRIQSELRLLGHDLAKSTVAKYVPRPRKPPSQSWKTFLANHSDCLAFIDLFTVPTVTFRNLYVFLVLRHDRRRVVHFAVTEQPSAVWVARQLKEAFPFDEAPHYLIRDNDGIYGHEVSRCLKAMGVEEVKTAPHSPWQNPSVERLVGTLRHECLDHVIVLNERHLERSVASFLDYYHGSRCHMAFDDNCPIPRDVAPPDKGEVVSIPMVGGLHHRYRRTG